jgi:acetylornithine deacetylase/succinyl-diaminopimelate desuccinylase-like protein
MPDQIQSFLSGHERALVDELCDWVRIPSVSGDPARSADLTRSAHWLAGKLREIGFPRVEVWPDNVVFAQWHAAPDAPTYLVYSHHDVRAVVEERWTETAPFVPAVRDGRVYGRGASDAKGQVVAHLWGVRAHLAASGRSAPAVNLTMLICAAEETGSEPLAQQLEEHRDDLRADVVLFTDTMLWRLDTPALCRGIRGTLKATLTVYGPEQDIHAGVVSGAAPNPLTELARLIAQLHDCDGRIMLPGFYDDVRAADPDEFAALPFDEKEWLATTQSRSVVGEAGFSVPERLWTRPSVEVATIEGSEPASPPRGVIPASASATLSFSLVPAQVAMRVGDQVRAWVAERISPHVAYDLEIAETTSADPYVTPDHAAVDRLVEAMERGFGRPVGRMRNGGTGPAELLAREVGAPVLFFGTGLPDDHWHAEDEKAEIEALLKGAATLAYLWTDQAPDGSGA